MALCRSSLSTCLFTRGFLGKPHHFEWKQLSEYCNFSQGVCVYREEYVF
jgi:hypothetical protein